MIPADALHETWETMERKSLHLAELIRESGQTFDALVTLPRGGYFPALVVARMLGFGAPDMLQACIGSYEDDKDRRGAFQRGQMPRPEDIRGKHLLVIDDVCDTGHTLEYVCEFLQKAGAASVKSGTIHYKPGRSQTPFKPDWFVEQTEKWIVYPWEYDEGA
jgi:hypothetical protein